MAKQTEAIPQAAEAIHTKQQFLESSLFTLQQKDLLNVLLEDGEPYSVEQVKQEIKDFLERKVTD